MVIRYKSEEDIRAELGAYDWDQLEGLDLDDELELDDDEPEGANAKFKFDMLKKRSPVSRNGNLKTPRSPSRQKRFVFAIRSRKSSRPALSWSLAGAKNCSTTVCTCGRGCRS